jgi:alkyldihydroxyacetonephosphate synthase
MVSVGLRDLSRVLPDLRASEDAADRVAYARDLWPRHHLAVRAGHVADHKPAGIVWPDTTEDVARIVRWAHDTGTPIVPFGAGSGVCAGILPSAQMIVIDLKRMARWRRLDDDARTLEVEAGHMGLPLEEDLERRGLTLGHFPSSILCSTVGGWVAARSAGQCSGKYGKIEDMVLALECITGTGQVVTLRHRTSGANLVPLLTGSEGTLAVITSVTLRLHPRPRTRAFAAFSFPTTEHGWEAMRAMFQAGLRPAVARLYDPFDAMLARRGAVKKGGADSGGTPGLGAAALRTLLRRPGALNDLLEGSFGSALLGGSLLVVIFEGDDDQPGKDLETARAMLERMNARYEGEGPAQKWLLHRYSVSYRQAPVFAAGLFSDTMEIAAPWSKLRGLYDSVRRALGEHVFVMAHLSHAYPDGCCIYFSFAGTAGALPTPGASLRSEGWDARCEATYDRAWRAALAAAVEAGGTLAHHHGVGRSKAPRLPAELGDAGVLAVKSLMRAFDPKGILNPGNLVPQGASPTTSACPPARARQASRGAASFDVDRASLLVGVPGAATLSSVEHALEPSGLTLGVPATDITVAEWLARGAPGAPTSFADPADHLVAGLTATLNDGQRIEVRPSPRRAVGPDLVALFFGARERFGSIEHAWLRVHLRGAPRAAIATTGLELDPRLSEEEESLLAAIRRELGAL